jgi:hypothetical protein
MAVPVSATLHAVSVRLPVSRRTRAALLGLAAVLGLALVPILAAPGIPATCTTILDLAAYGEAVDEDDRYACEQHYGQLRSRRGVLGWTWLSWCTWLAHSIPEAGEC